MKKIFLFCLLIVLFTACDKNVEAKREEICKEGFIMWGHDPALDGIGWYFSESLNGGTQAYKFDNLPEAYQQDKLPVHICFYETDKEYPCFCGTPLKVYHITTIKQGN